MKKNFKVEEPEHVLLSTFFEELKEELILSALKRVSGLYSRKISEKELQSVRMLLFPDALQSRESLYIFEPEDEEYIISFREDEIRERLLRVNWNMISGIIFFEPMSQKVQAILKQIPNSVPVLLTAASPEHVHRYINLYLLYKFSPFTLIHASAVEVFGEGVVLMGGSGSGKSESVLELMRRGHFFVADDLVKLVDYPYGAVTVTSGSSRAELRYFMELRGLGIMDVMKAFGPGRIKSKTELSLIVELSKPESVKGTVAHEEIEIFRRKFPIIKLPTRVNELIVSRIEAAVLAEKLRKTGFDTSDVLRKVLDEEHDKEIT